MDIKWVRIVSWHALRPDDHFGPTTYCGRDATDKEIVEDLPGTGKKCDTCEGIVLRILEHSGEVG